MKTTPYAAFGHRVFLCEVEAGDDSTNYDLGDDGLNHTSYSFCTKGSIKTHVIETGEQLPDRVAGWLTSENLDDKASTGGTVRKEFSESTEWLCIPKARLYDLPIVSSLVVDDCETTKLGQSTNLYLVRGTLSISGRLFVGPCEIRIRSGDLVATSVGTSYSLVFP